MSVVGRFASASASPVLSQDQGGTLSAPVSNGVFPADLHGIRRKLPNEWAGFLNAHFNGDIGLITAFFEVDGKTARDWLSGKHGVNAAPLLKLLRKEPKAVAHFIGDAA